MKVSTKAFLNIVLALNVCFYVESELNFLAKTSEEVAAVIATGERCQKCITGIQKQIDDIGAEYNRKDREGTYGETVLTR